MKYPTSNVKVVEVPQCSLCDAPAVYFYPGPLCRTCHADWSE